MRHFLISIFLPLHLAQSSASAEFIGEPKAFNLSQSAPLSVVAVKVKVKERFTADGKAGVSSASQWLAS